MLVVFRVRLGFTRFRVFAVKGLGCLDSGTKKRQNKEAENYKICDSGDNVETQL